MSVGIAVSTSDLEYARATLDGIANGAPIAIRSAINDTLKSGRAEWVRATKEHLNTTAAEIRKRISISDRPTAFSLTGTLTAKNQPIRFEEFKPRWTKAGGVNVTGIKDLGPTIFPHGFKATMKSGHQGVYQRVKLGAIGAGTTIEQLKAKGFQPQGGAISGPVPDWMVGRGFRHQKRSASGGEFTRVTPRGISWRLPMKDLMGPSVVTASDKVPDLIPKVSKVIADKFSERLMSKVEWQLSKAKPTLPPETE